MEQAVDVMDVLRARDRRAARQQELLAQYGVPLISFTMNIAGPVKRTALIDRGFTLALQRLEGQLRACRAAVLHQELVREATGCEALYAVDLPPRQLKALCVALEEADELGRLLDLDVLDRDGVKLNREKERGCLICGSSGKGCARSRAHSVAQLQQRTEEILRRVLSGEAHTRIGELACRALLYEACTAPKPGLVDRCNCGSHADMDLFTFMAGAAALQPYFTRCAAIGQETAQQPPQATFTALRSVGRLAEGEMLRATGGVNTHKGAVFLMGLACAALGRLGRSGGSAAVLRECAAMAAGVTAELDGAADTAGERFYRDYGLRGVRGEAEDGFPSVETAGLPTLERALAEGKSPEQAGCEALLALMSVCEDTALVHRVGYEGWQQVKARAAQLLREGVTQPALEQFDRDMIARNASPGGSADLLALCWLLHFWENEQ